MLTKFLSRPDSNTLWRLLLLFLPSFEIILLFAILLSGLNKVDLYHMAFLLFFVGYLIYPKKEEQITRIVLVYSFVFIVLKHAYTLIDTDWIANNEDFLSAMGLATEWDKPDDWGLFEYPFKPQQWAVLCAAWAYMVASKLLGDREQIERSMKQARKDLRLSWP